LQIQSTSQTSQHRNSEYRAQSWVLPRYSWQLGSNGAWKVNLLLLGHYWKLTAQGQRLQSSSGSIKLGTSELNSDPIVGWFWMLGVCLLSPGDWERPHLTMMSAAQLRKRLREQVGDQEPEHMNPDSDSTTIISWDIMSPSKGCSYL
jgi:hypothetical protein